MMASALPDIAKKYGIVYSADFSGSVRLICNLAARYHEPYNSGHDALDFLSIICNWAAIQWTII